MRPDVLTERRRLFEERGAFFHALLGLLVVTRRLETDLGVAPPEQPGDAPHVERSSPRAPHPSDYLLLGLVSVRGRVLELMQWLPADAVARPDRRRAPVEPRSLLR